MNRYRLHRVSQGATAPQTGAAFNGRTPGRTMFQEAGGGRSQSRGSTSFSSLWDFVLAITGPMLAGLFTGLVYRSLRRK